MKQLSREEMRNLKGGDEEETLTGICSASCIGSTGSWQYTTPGGVSFNTCRDDVHTYCSTQTGGCSFC